MHTRTKLLMAALIAALALSLAATTANALRSLSVEGSTTISANGIITFEKAGTSTIECPATVVSTVSSVIPKRIGVLGGGLRTLITERPNATNCRSLPASNGPLQNIIILEITNTAKYRGFFQGITGTLPIITGIKGTGEGARMGFEVRTVIGSIRCLYEERVRAEGRPSEATSNLNERQQLVSITGGANLALRTPESSGLCPSEGELRGRMTVLAPLVTIKLI